ncbi:YdcF family protein [Aestuariivirga sp.]|uniref:YdcF family protein n=1 Tax=Aestuariivirga sp. TaxID=2650926 RepID=UPI003BA891DA
MLYLAKIIAILASPLGFLLAVACGGLALMAWGSRRLGLFAMTLALLGLWIAAMPVTGRLALGALERAYPPMPVSAAPLADVAIVLGGGVSGPSPGRPFPDLHEAADRVLYGAELFKAGKVKAVLVSGGQLPWLGGDEPEAETMRRLLISWGVAPDAVLIEGKSRTTAENAREVKAMWGGRGFSSALLVTSAGHMPRALATFRKAGLPVTPFPVDIRAAPEPLDLLDFLPDPDALKQTADAVKEAIGYTVYWLRGEA